MMVNSFGWQLRQQCALGLKSTLAGLSLCPKNGTDNKTNPEKAVSC